MRTIDRLARVLIFALLMLAYPASYAADFNVPDADGWYSWEVPAGPGGLNACCYHSRNGNTTSRGCSLDDGHSFVTMADCDIEADRIRVYVHMRAGTPKKVRALSANCPTRSATNVTDLGNVEPALSVAWLEARIDHGGRISSDIVAAISMHAGDSAFDTLTTLLEDRSRGMKVREEALFWLAQSGSDQAFDYLDRILSR